MIILFAPETYRRCSYSAIATAKLLTCCTDPIKLREKARLMRKETGDDRWKAPSKQIATFALENDGLDPSVHVTRVSFSRAPYYQERSLIYLGCSGEIDEVDSTHYWSLSHASISAVGARGHVSPALSPLSRPSGCHIPILWGVPLGVRWKLRL